MEMEEGRRKLKLQLRRNSRTYRQALNFPDMRRGHHSLKLTVPEEFNLSVSNRSLQEGDRDSFSRTLAPGAGSQRGTAATTDSAEKGRPWPKSLRPKGSSGWAPALTVPVAPQLCTPKRHRSSSGSRRGGDGRSMSCERLPRREQQAVERHLQRSKSLHASAAVDRKALELSDEDRRWIEAGSTAEVRAVRARKAMQRRQEEAYKKERERLFVFGAVSTRCL